MDFVSRTEKIRHLLHAKYSDSWDGFFRPPHPYLEQRRLNAAGRWEYSVRPHTRNEAENTEALTHGRMVVDEIRMRAMSDADIDVLYEACIEDEAGYRQRQLELDEQRRQQQLELDEQRHSFNQPSAKAPDYDYWVKADKWELDEAIALLMGRAPEFLKSMDVLKFAGHSRFAHAYDRWWRLAQHAEAMNYGQASRPVAVLAWADDVNIPIPSGLLEAFESRAAKKLPPVDLASDRLFVAPETGTHRKDHGESVVERQDRRLARLHSLGGEMTRKTGGSWKQSGLRGALAQLVKEEKAASRRQSDRKNISDDLSAAAERAQRAGI